MGSISTVDAITLFVGIFGFAASTATLYFQRKAKSERRINDMIDESRRILPLSPKRAIAG